MTEWRKFLMRKWSQRKQNKSFIKKCLQNGTDVRILYVGEDEQMFRRRNGHGVILWNRQVLH